MKYSQKKNMVSQKVKLKKLNAFLISDDIYDYFHNGAET